MLCDESYRISGEIGNHWGQSYCLLNAYHVDLSQGNVGRALDRMRECVEHAELAGFVIPQAMTRAEMGAAYATLGEIERGKALADEGLVIAREHNALAIPIVKAAEAEILLLAGRARRGRGRDRREQPQQASPDCCTSQPRPMRRS